MHFQRHIHFDDLAAYKDQWNHLLQKSASHVPFLTFEYQQAWWQTRGGGEWPQDSQLVVITACEGDRLVGVAPLFFTQNILGRPALMFVGAIEVSDFLDFIVEPEELPGFLSGLLDFLIENKENLPPWELIDLYNLLEGSPSLAALEAEAKQRGWAHQQIHLQPAPFIPLPGDYQAYLADLDKKQRHEIRRKWRNVENSLAEPGFYIVEDRDRLQAETQAFIDMMAQDPNKRDFLTEPMVAYMHDITQAAFEAGWLQLSFFTLDGKKAAAYLCFGFNHDIYCYNSGWEWDFREYSPGWVLLAYLLEWANENGFKKFDFMRGDEDYKYKFGGVDRNIYRVTLEPDSRA
jgi:CelD/BcsL family acetyltransferase involved in cellulose biosynthesis